MNITLTLRAWDQVNKIVEGCGDASFDHNELIVREQMASVLQRYAQLKGCDVSVGESVDVLSYSGI